MHYRFMALATLCIGLLLSAVPTALAQAKPPSDLSAAQRLEVMRSKLESLRRSLNNAISTLPPKSTDKKQPVDDPRLRLQGLEKEVSSVLSDVNDIRGKQDRSERYDATEIDRLESSVVDIDTRAQAGLQATASARTANVASGQAPAKKKKKGKFFGLFGGGGEDKYAELTGEVAAGRDRVLFLEATKQVRKGSHETGRLLFTTIINTYPDSPYLPLAKLAIADSFYLEGTTSNLIQAAQSYQDWLTFFPTDPLAPYAMLKVAESEMRQMGLSNRDTSHARKAEQRLKVLLQQFPQTKIRPDVEHRLREVQENLAMHNLQIGTYYGDRYERGKGGLKGAQYRFREIVEKYPDFSFMDEVLYRLAATYQQEEEPDEAAKYYQQLLRNHPNSEFAEKSREQLGIIGVPVPDPDPTRKNAQTPARPGMIKAVLQEVSGKADVTVDKNGVLISKDGKEGTDLIDEAAKNNGQLPNNVTPKAPTQLGNPKIQANPGPRSGAQNVTPVNTNTPTSTPIKP